MKLYYFTGACSLSPHIALRESGLEFEAVRVDVKTRTLADGTDYYSIHPLAYVPLLELDDGARMTEGPAIVQYIADQVPHKRLAPAPGSLERYRLQEWLNFISTELHKGFTPMFNSSLAEEAKALFREKLGPVLKWLDGRLAGTRYLVGDGFTVADAYLYTVTMPYRSKRAGLDLSGYANLQALRDRVAERPAVRAALKAEGLQ